MVDPGSRRAQRRQIAALGVIAALIAVPLYMLVFHDDSGGGSSGAGEGDLVKAAKDPREAAKVLNQHVAEPKLGIAIRYPARWRGETADGAVRVRDSSTPTGLGIVSPGPAKDAKKIFRAAVGDTKASFKQAKVTFVPAAQQNPLAGLPTAGAVVRDTTSGPNGQSALVLVSRGKQRSYLTTVFSPPGGGDLPTAQLVLARGVTLSG
jgi:hypothetical protein